MPAELNIRRNVTQYESSVSMFVFCWLFEAVAPVSDVMLLSHLVIGPGTVP